MHQIFLINMIQKNLLTKLYIRNKLKLLLHKKLQTISKINKLKQTYTYLNPRQGLRRRKNKDCTLLFRKHSRKFNIIMAKNKLIKTKLVRKFKKIMSKQSKSRKYLASNANLIFRSKK